MLGTKPCRHCESPYHQSWQCRLIAKHKLKSHKPMKRVGKVGKNWQKDRAEWIKNHPSNHQGYWRCELRRSPQCLGFVDADQLQVDHAKSRTRAPEKRRDQTNFQAACSFCNAEKGSTD